MITSTANLLILLSPLCRALETNGLTTVPLGLVIHADHSRELLDFKTSRPSCAMPELSAGGEIAGVSDIACDAASSELVAISHGLAGETKAFRLNLGSNTASNGWIEMSKLLEGTPATAYGVNLNKDLIFLSYSSNSIVSLDRKTLSRLGVQDFGSDRNSRFEAVYGASGGSFAALINSHLMEPSFPAVLSLGTVGGKVESIQIPQGWSHSGHVWKAVS